MSILKGGIIAQNGKVKDRGSGLLNLPEKIGPQNFTSEIKVKDGKVKNPKKRKMY